MKLEEANKLKKGDKIKNIINKKSFLEIEWLSPVSKDNLISYAGVNELDEKLAFVDVPIENIIKIKPSKMSKEMELYYATYKKKYVEWACYTKTLELHTILEEEFLIPKILITEEKKENILFKNETGRVFYFLDNGNLELAEDK